MQHLSNGTPVRHHFRIGSAFAAALLGLCCLPGAGLAQAPPAATAPAAAGEVSAAAAPAPASASPSPAAGRATAVLARMTLKVIHPDQVRAELVAAARARGGHPVLITDHALHLKVPPAQVEVLLRLAADKGVVLDKSLSREDLTESIASREGRVRSRQEILVRLRRFIDDSNVAATLKIERTMTDLVTELEGLKGQLAVERERARFAVLSISFNYQRQGRISYVRSPFDWLNSVDLNRFLREF